MEGRSRGLPDAHRARNVILDDETVRRIVKAAHAHDRALGLMVEVAAVTGARLSQLARLEVGDLQADRLRLMLPRSAKGRVRTRRTSGARCRSRFAWSSACRRRRRSPRSRAVAAPRQWRAVGERGTT